MREEFFRSGAKNEPRGRVMDGVPSVRILKTS